MNCEVCGREMVLEVLLNHSGWYVGYVCSCCGPQTRETKYYASPAAATFQLAILKEEE